jgi:hypothetical protein
MRELMQQLLAVQQAVRAGTIAGSKVLEKVRKDASVPATWYSAAAKVASEQFEDYNHKAGVKMLAEESWLLHEFGTL